jgi:predicted nucleotidyltransferase/predicted transcriptional regulator with HTH domain
MRITNESVFAALFGTELKRKVLAFLGSNDMALTERELSRRLRVSHTAVNKVMKQLLEMNAVECMSIGKALVWHLNEKSFTYQKITDYIKLADLTPLEYVKDMIAEGVKEEIERINEKKQTENAKLGKKLFPRIEAAYIYGSVASGKARPESDIDVLILLEKDFDNDNLREVLEDKVGKPLMEKTGNFVSFSVYSQEAVHGNEPHWLKTAIEKGIRVY